VNTVGGIGLKERLDEFRTTRRSSNSFPTFHRTAARSTRRLSERKLLLTTMARTERRVMTIISRTDPFLRASPRVLDPLIFWKLESELLIRLIRHRWV